MLPRRPLIPLILLFMLAGFTAGCSMQGLRSKPGTTTTFVLLRHGDRDAGSEQLNMKGQERARALVGAVADMGITAIYSPDLTRNIETVQPLAERLGIDITVVPEFGYSNSRSTVEEMLFKHAGGVVVFVGNVSGSLQGVYKWLGGTGTGPEDYGDLFILAVPDQGPIEVNKLRFGP
jgi:hypothetical protein